MRTRFAPSPTGPLHLGHAYSAMLAHDMARAAGGTFLLRIEDIDIARSRPEHEAAIFDDLAWLGLSWPVPVMRQSARLPAYRAAIDRLGAMGLTYLCRCTRRDIAEAFSAPQEGAGAPHPAGPDGVIYPGTCRARCGQRPGPEDAIRLDMARAVRLPGILRGFEETGPAHAGQHALDPVALVEGCGDIVLARRDLGCSYHVAVVVDDAAQEITHVVRGEDLFEATRIHIILQMLLGLSSPIYHHHRLIRDAAGQRLAKRDDARALARYRGEGATPESLRADLGLGPVPAS